MNTLDQLRALCRLVEVPLDGLTDAELEIIAIRVVMDGRATPVAIGSIVDNVRWQRAEGKPAPAEPSALSAAGVEPSSVVPAPAALDIPLGQRAMDAAVAGFDEVAQRRRQRPGACHPACLSSWADHGTACFRCTYLLCADEACTHDACGWERYFSNA